MGGDATALAHNWLPEVHFDQILPGKPCHRVRAYERVPPTPTPVQDFDARQARGLRWEK